jgi:hypothetical protein
MYDAEKYLTVFNAMGTDKAKSHDYHLYYKDVFTEKTKSLLEIGIKQGKSLAAWRALFPGIELYGLDNNPKSQDKEYINYAKANRIVNGDSTVQSVTGNFPSVDVIIDDGSHFYKDQIKTFNVFHGKFKKVYVIEDVLYKCDEIVEAIKAKGYTNVTVYPSKTKNVAVDLNLVENDSKEKSGQTVNIDLFMIVVRK